MKGLGRSFSMILLGIAVSCGSAVKGTDDSR
jgi:hypothetical protein